MKKKDNGITLIALVITIIVLIILAGVTINLMLGTNGVLKQAQKASIETKLARNGRNSGNNLYGFIFAEI